MWERLLQFILSFALEKILNLLTKKWEEYKDDQEKQQELKRKVKAIKDAKTKEEIRTAIRDLSI